MQLFQMSRTFISLPLDIPDIPSFPPGKDGQKRLCQFRRTKKKDCPAKGDDGNLARMEKRIFSNRH